MAGGRSSNSYVAMQVRVPEDDAPRFRSGKLKGLQIPFVTTICDHCAYICATEACVKGWEIDYIVYLDRTIAGRYIKKVLSR